MAAVYNRYRVYSTDVRITAVSKHSSNYPAVLAIYASNVNTAVTTTDLAIETSFS